jgi:AraC-like DNA-binding protein
MQGPELLHISSINPLLDGCRRRGVDPAYILEEIGLPAELLADPESLFPVSKVGDLIAAIALNLEDETLGFMQRRTGIGGLEMSIHAVISSKYLNEALQRWLHYWRLLHDDNQCCMSVHGEEVRVVIGFCGDETLDRTSFITWITFVFVRIAGWLIDKPILLDRLSFTFDEPRDVDDYRAMFPTRHYYNDSENMLVFNKRFLDVPVLQTPESVPDFVKILPHLATVNRVDRSLTGQIRRMLQGNENIDALPLKVIASQLNKSQDTVRRHLKNEGSSYSEIKECVRRDTAVYHLERTATSISQIAYMLSFSEPSAFNRAFKKWTGVTPGDYRQARQLMAQFP